MKAKRRNKVSRLYEATSELIDEIWALIRSGHLNEQFILHAVLHQLPREVLKKLAQDGYQAKEHGHDPPDEDEDLDHWDYLTTTEEGY